MSHEPPMRHVVVLFEDESGNVLQEARMPAVPRIGEAVELGSVEEPDTDYQGTVVAVNWLSVVSTEHDTTHCTIRVVLKLQEGKSIG